MKKNIVIIILLVIVLCLGGYLVYDKLLLNDNNEIQNNQDKDESNETEYNLIEAKNLIDKYYINDFFSGNSFDGYTEKLMFWLAYNSLDKSKITTTKCSNLYEGKNNVIKDGETNYIINEGTDNVVSKKSKFCDAQAETVTYEDMLIAYKYLFGSNKYLKKEDVSQFDYDVEKNIFILLGCRCGGGNPNRYIYGVKAAKKIGNNLIIDVGYSTLEYNSYRNEYYSFVDNKFYASDEINKEDFEKTYIEKNLYKMDTYKFTFVKDIDHYVLENVVKVIK